MFDNNIQVTFDTFNAGEVVTREAMRKALSIDHKVLAMDLNTLPQTITTAGMFYVGSPELRVVNAAGIATDKFIHLAKDVVQTIARMTTTPATPPFYIVYPPLTKGVEVNGFMHYFNLIKENIKPNEDFYRPEEVQYILEVTIGEQPESKETVGSGEEEVISYFTSLTDKYGISPKAEGNFAKDIGMSEYMGNADTSIFKKYDRVYTRNTECKGSCCAGKFAYSTTNVLEIVGSGNLSILETVGLPKLGLLDVVATDFKHLNPPPIIIAKVMEDLTDQDNNKLLITSKEEVENYRTTEAPADSNGEGFLTVAAVIEMREGYSVVDDNGNISKGKARPVLKVCFGPDDPSLDKETYLTMKSPEVVKYLFEEQEVYNETTANLH